MTPSRNHGIGEDEPFTVVCRYESICISLPKHLNNKAAIQQQNFLELLSAVDIDGSQTPIAFTSFALHLGYYNFQLFNLIIWTWETANKVFKKVRFVLLSLHQVWFAKVPGTQ
ncbi:hypothetical protein SLEP1_g4601 [Rubroshorea leprosula]|uniref:Uncharacterized protein n=1 Tax=Rubroshorea leprosula TaxID=152421 RepID=A0AAV5HWZ6_9ROSI|nr:hypothetical protein SLEP1_g4601 [Rubroshorea leprosula]